MNERIYLDYNATAPLRPNVYEKVSQALLEIGNPSSIHAYGRQARQNIEQARGKIARLINTDPENIIFNSGATESNNTVLRKYGSQGIAISAIEHPCVREYRHDEGEIPVNEDGILDLEMFEETISRPPPPALVSVMMVNNETGVIQPIQDIAEICRNRGVRLHTDGAQAAGRIPINLAALGCNYFTLSSHKMGGPQGVGALVVEEKTSVPVLISGGGQERSKRAGTENVPGIIGFGEAAEHGLNHLEDYNKLSDLRQKLEKGLRTIAEDVEIFGERVARVANTTCFSIPGMNAETMIIALDLEGIAVSSGSACSSGKVARSHVLEAMGVSEDLLSGALRISTGWDTKEAHIDRFLEVMETLVKRTRK